MEILPGRWRKVLVTADKAVPDTGHLEPKRVTRRGEIRLHKGTKYSPISVPVNL